MIEAEIEINKTADNSEMLANPNDQLIMRLRRYNEWRRGADFEQPDPACLGHDIDAAVSLIDEMNKKSHKIRQWREAYLLEILPEPDFKKAASSETNADKGEPELSGLVSCRDPNLMRHAVRMMQDYWGTYDMQRGYEDYRVGTLIDDAIYGLGMAIDKEQFQCADGYDRFKAILREHLSN